MLNQFKGDRKDDWQTPQSLFAELNSWYHFTTDLAADAENSKCQNHFTVESNALIQDWSQIEGTAWLNPPYSRSEDFFRKAILPGTRLIAIYKAANLETKVWQDLIIPHCDWICFLRGRTNYLNKGKYKDGVPFGSALIGYGVTCHEIIKGLGRIWMAPALIS